MKLIAKFDELDSTNRYANEELDFSKVEEFGIVWTLHQTAGKGQQHNTWESEAGKNLLFSMIFFPSFLFPSQQFVLTQILSLGVVDYLKQQLPNSDVKIKWPNDIYVGHFKICGILVHNKIIGTKIYATVAGAGININQERFSQAVPNAISLRNIKGKIFDLEIELASVSSCIKNRYNTIKQKGVDVFQQEYLNNLLNYKQSALYIYNNAQIWATIENVNEFGHLELIKENGEMISCDLKEIQFKI